MFIMIVMCNDKASMTVVVWMGSTVKCLQQLNMMRL